MREIAQVPALMLLTLAVKGPCAANSIRPPGKVTVLPFVITVQPIDGAPGRADQEAIVRRLTEEATTRAERSLLQQRLAAAVERLTLTTSAGVPGSRAMGEAASDRSLHSADQPAEPVWVTGAVHLPVSLPPQLTGPRAWFHRGRFATAEVRVQRPEGEVIAREEATLDWREVRWFTGAGRLRHSRPLDEVLVDFVRKATDRAIKRLKADQAAWAAP